MKKTYTGTWKKVTPQQMVNRLKLDLSITPKWRVFRRLQIKRNIEFWKGQVIRNMGKFKVGDKVKNKLGKKGTLVYIKLKDTGDVPYVVDYGEYWHGEMLSDIKHWEKPCKHKPTKVE